MRLVRYVLIRLKVAVSKPHRSRRQCNPERIAIMALFGLSLLWPGSFCCAQTFHGDFLAGLPSGSFDTWGMAAGDFNGDGKLDIATVSLNEGTLNVFLGNGDGTFSGGFTYTFTGPINSPISVIASDVNGDGILDLIVASYNTLNLSNGGAVSVFFGKGDGTFEHEADYILNSHPVAVAAADFNGDKVPDLAVTVNDAGTVAILLNNGDGTFQEPVSYAASSGPYSIVAADFSGDGNSDLVVTNYCVTGQSPLVCNGSYVGTVSVLLGKGDGTFQPATSFPVGAAPNGIAAATLQSGGNIDLLVTDAGYNESTFGSLWVLLGKGDGTFQTPVGYPADAASGDGSSRVVTDFNGDGKLDVVASGLSLVEFLGNGDGTLQPAVDYYRSTSGYPYFDMISGDFNGDGHPDVAVGFQTVFSVFLNAAGTTRQSSTTTVGIVNNGCGSATVNATVTSGSQAPTGTLTLQVDGQYYTAAQFPNLNSSGQASVNITLSIGTHTIAVFYAGDSLTQGNSSSQSVDIKPLASSASLVSSPNPSAIGQLVGFTATVTPTGSPTSCLSGSVTFFDGATSLGTVPLQVSPPQAYGYGLLATSALALGSHSITASYSGANYIAPSTSPVLIQVVETPSTAVLTPASLSFPNTIVDESSPGQTAQLSNTGQLALTITNILTQGDFNEGNNCGTSLASGQSCTITVTFAPTQTGTRSGQISVNDSAGTQVVNLSGNGVLAVTLSPASLTFVDQAVGSASPPQSVVVTNYSSTSLTISSIMVTGSGSADFAQTNNCGHSLGAGATCQIMVTFTPVSLGVFNATLSISDSGPGSPQMATLTGSTNIVSAVNLSPLSLTFPTQYVSTSGLPQTVTLTNTGNAPLTITTVSTTSPDFGQLSSCGNTVAAGTSCSIGVFFDPTASGTRSGALTITDNAAGSPQSVSLSGMGQDFSLTPSSSSSATILGGTGSNLYDLSCAWWRI